MKFLSDKYREPNTRPGRPSIGMAVKLLTALGMVLGLSSCLTFGDKYESLPPGIWRGVLVLSQETDDFDEHTGGELPFNFEVIYDRPDSFYIVIHNGDERIIVDDIRTGVDRTTARDTIFINFPVYDTHITAQYEEDAIEGWWVVRNRPNYRVKFKAVHAKPYRFFEMDEPPAADLTGRWDCTFGLDKDMPTRSVGEFVQRGNKLTGTFMSLTGDDRFLEGTVSGDRVFLSVFDGTHAYLYEAKILPDGSLTGIYRSGNHYKTYWSATKADSLTLHDLGNPLQLTQTQSDAPISLSFPDPDGRFWDIHQPPLSGKPKIIQITGTWCPNCRDESLFLLDYLAEHPDPGFELMAIAFERHTDTLKALEAIRTYRDKMNIPYPITYGGTNQKSNASEMLPMLDKVVAFPTLLFLDRQNRVVATHTGFAGPATSEYVTFKRDFENLVAKITGHDE